MLTKIKNGSETKDNRDSLFVKKWQQIEKKQKRNANTKKKVEGLYQQFQDEVLPEEQTFFALLVQETHHLITFLPRKSFTQWQREELQAWIESNLDELNQHPFGDRALFEDVAKTYSDALVEQAQKINKDHDFLPEEIDYMRSMADEMFEGEKSFSDEELESFLRDPAIFQGVLRDFLANKTEQFDFTDEESDDEFEQEEQEYYRGGNSHDNYRSEQALKKENKLKSLFNASNLNKLYKLLANRLHPDKEINEYLKAEKSELMSKLVTAKKNKDAFTLISMFHQFMPESENTFFDGNDEELNTALVMLLDQKIDQLDQENHDEKYENGVKSMIWHRFNGRSKKATLESISTHLADLEDGHTRLNYYIHEVKTVKSLKEILSERYEQRSFNPFGGEDLSFEDFEKFFS